jgi:putative ATP-dependent endonuclease of OLD family
MRISRVKISNFRNFKSLDVSLSEHAVIVGENKIGKSNLLYALRLLLDPTLPDAARQLREEDFWDGLTRPLSADNRITITVDLTDYEEDEDLLAVLAEHVISTEPMVSQLTYQFGASAAAEGTTPTKATYDFIIYGGDRPENKIGWDVRRRIPMDLLPALRDAEGDLANWRRSPLRPILDDAASRIGRPELVKLTEGITSATAKLTETAELTNLALQISDRLEEMVGSSNALDTTLGFSPTEPDRLLRSLRLFIDGGKRGIGEASLGSANLLYITLKALELDQLVQEGNRHHTFLAIEEPEAHLHPHLQRLVYRDFLRRRKHQEAPENEALTEPASSTTILLTTHSPHIASVSPLDSFVLLRKAADGSTEGVSTASITMDEKDRLDLERYLDVTRGEILFAKGVVLVEGDAELYLVPALARLQGFDLDALGISICSVSGTNFAPYVKLLGPAALNIPFVVLTDFDPGTGGGLGEARVSALLGILGHAVGAAKGVALKTVAATTGIFMNDHTLEVDLFKCGQHKSMGRTLIELAESKPAGTRAAGWAKIPATLDAPTFLSDIKAIGKGRFAQRLATGLAGSPCPAYIKDALTYVATHCK